MSEPTTTQPAHGGSSYWAVPLAVVLLYVLSIGPAARIARNRPQLTSALQIFYYPVIALHDHTPLKRPLEVYVELWGVK